MKQGKSMKTIFNLGVYSKMISYSIGAYMIRILECLVGLSILSLFTPLALANNCEILGCPTCAITIEEMDNNLTVNISGDSPPSKISEPDGDTLFYSGPANGNYLSYGPYYDQAGSKIIVSPSLILSTQWSPVVYYTCTERNWRSECVGWASHNRETGFTVDYMVNRKIIYSEVFKNLNKLKKSRLGFPPIRCDGDLEDLEVRVHSAYGGNVKFRIHELILETRWND